MPSPAAPLAAVAPLACGDGWLNSGGSYGGDDRDRGYRAQPGYARGLDWIRHPAVVRLAAVGVLSASLTGCGCGGGGAADGGGGASGDASTSTDASASASATSSSDPGEASGDSGDTSAPTEDAFDPTVILDVQIEMDPADWDRLRNEWPPAVESPDNHGPACLPHNNPRFSYSTYPSTVTIEGETLELVGVRKRTWCGSESAEAEKPALKLDFNLFSEGREWRETNHLTLNNAILDPAYVRQCLAFRQFAAAGLPASRCSFAQVTVNGEAYGIYVNLESVGDDYFERNLVGDGGEGNAYKGFLADFSPELVAYFEKETNEDDPDRSDLDLVVAAIDPAVPDGELEASLAAVVDLPSFFTYWSMEVVLAHVDGYAGNTNNFVVYHADDGRFRFLPWGLAATFGAFGSPTALSNALLPSRLCANPDTAADYTTALQGVLDSAWDEASILAEIDRMEALLAPELPPDTLTAPLADVRAFVDGRRAQIDDALAGTTPCQGAGPPGSNGTVEATFATTWDSLGAGDPVMTGSGTIDLVLDGVMAVANDVGAVAGVPPDSPDGVLQIAALLDDGSTVIVIVVLGPDPLPAGTELPANGAVLIAEAGGMPMPIGGLANATLTLTEAGSTAGAAFEGSIQGAF